MKHFPSWLRKERLPSSVQYTSRILTGEKLNTVCESAKCPNRMECFGRKTATFMILGEVCTRKCGFCSIEAGKPVDFDDREPERVARAAFELGLKHVVVTSVARDDLRDGGAKRFADTICAIRNLLPESTIEVLTPDFKLNFESIDIVCSAGPDIYNHNIETVERLTPVIRSPLAQYAKSLRLLKYVKAAYPNIITKSGMMLGLGETREEVMQALEDLRSHNCDVLTMGQYLQPTKEKLEVSEFIPPFIFEFYEQKARELGFREAYCGPFVRSSYHAGELSEKVLN